MRNGYTADWAFAVSNEIKKFVEKNLPNELYTWPIIKCFDFEAYICYQHWMIITIKDKLSGITSGPGLPKELFDESMPDIPKENNINDWQSYIKQKFKLRSQDVCIIIPIHDSGRNNVEEGWKLLTKDEKNLWYKQIEIINKNLFYYKKGIKSMDNEFFIPSGYQFLQAEIVRFLKDNSEYNKNVFIMTRFVPGNKLLETLDSELKRVFKSYGMNLLRADDKMYMMDRNLWNNVCVYMIGCKYGISILEDRIRDEFNPNVALEYGFMRALNKPTLLLADAGFRNLRADIIGTLRESFDITDIENTIRLPIEKWFKDLEIIKN